MASFQSKLGEGDSIAEDLASNQRQISIAEFFEKNKQMLGFDSEARGIVTAVKEAVDNSLDAAEEAGYLPEIYVEIAEAGDYYKLVVEDNGPGVTKEEIPNVFGKLLYGSRFHARVQSRGQQGIGISAAVMYSQLTSGKPAKITSKTEGRDTAQYFELRIDTDTNEPEIQRTEEVEWKGNDDHGTRIELEMAANMRSRNNLHDYIRHTAVVNPHAKVTFDEPALDEPMEFDRVSDELPAKPKEIKPHPHGVELGALKKMLEDTDSYSLSGFLQEEFTRVGGKTADNILDNFRDRMHGREMSWVTPDDIDLLDIVSGAVNNKSQEETERYATLVAEQVAEVDRLTYSNVRDIIDDAADGAVEEFGRSFGSTVREKTTDAVWEAVREERTDDLVDLVTTATSDRKDDDAVEALARSLGAAFEASTGDKDRLTHEELTTLVAEKADQVEYDHDEKFGQTSIENIVDEIWGVMETVPDELPSVKEIADDRDAISDLLEGMQIADVIAPPSDCLSPISDELIEKGLKQVYDANFFAAASRDAGVHSGEPFVAEAGIAYGGDLTAEGKADILRFANRVPLVYQRGACATTDVVKRIGWRNYGVNQSGGRGIPEDEIVILVHVASTNVPFTSESKDALANVEVIEDEVERAIRDAARKLKDHLNKKESLEKRRRKQNVLADLLPEMAEKAASVVGEEPADVEPSMARIMNSLMLDQSNEEELKLKNYTGGSQSVTAELHFDDGKPTYPSDNAERVETNDGWKLVVETSIDDGDTETVTWNLDADEEPTIEVDGLAEEEITYTE